MYQESINRPELTFQNLTHFAKSEDEAYLARLRHLLKGRVLAHTTGAPSRPLSCPQAQAPPRKVCPARNLIAPTDQRILYWDQVPVTTGKEELSPSTIKSGLTQQMEEEEEDLYFVHKQKHRRLLPEYIKFGDGKSIHVGWIYSRPKKFICHVCYAREHISPQFQFKLFQLDKVVTNYEALAEEEQKTVLDTSYENAKYYLAIKGPNAKKTADIHQTDYKNQQGGS